LNLTDPGFVLLLLPAAAALYYCCPKKLRTLAICFISAAGVIIIEPVFGAAILASAVFDSVTSVCLDKKGSDSPLSATFYLLSMVKDTAAIIIFGVVRPLFAGEAASPAILIAHFTLICALAAQKRGRVAFSSPFVFFGHAVMLGHLPFGPTADPARTVPTLKTPECSYKKVGEGILLIIFGCAKRVLLAEQLFALYKTLLRIPTAQMSVASAWLAALCPAMGICFVFSAYSDIAQGIGMIFGVDIPRMAYYPFQAKGVRESVYRLNMALEDSIGNLIFPGWQRDSREYSSLSVSILTPFALAIVIGASFDSLLWACWLSSATAIDWLIQRKFRIPSILLRLSSLIVTVPAYSLLTGSSLQKASVLATMFGFGGAPLVNDSFVYQVVSNVLLLVISVVLCSSLISTLLLWIRRRRPEIWWIATVISSVPILVVTVSFMIRNVR